MAGRKEYIVAHPNGEDHVTELKGGKVPTFATWAFFAPYSHMDGETVVRKPEGWYLCGWSFKTEMTEAEKAKVLPDLRKNGIKVTATRVLPAGF